MFHWNVLAFFLYKFTASYSSASSTPSDLYSFLLPEDWDRHLIQTMSNGQKLTQSYLTFGSQWKKPTGFPLFWTLMHALRTPVLTDICVKRLSTTSYNDTYCLLPLIEVGYKRISTEHKNEMDNYCSFTDTTVCWHEVHCTCRTVKQQAKSISVHVFHCWWHCNHNSWKHINKTSYSSHF
jgi:hypothetical protein